MGGRGCNNIVSLHRFGVCQSENQRHTRFRSRVVRLLRTILTCVCVCCLFPFVSPSPTGTGSTTNGPRTKKVVATMMSIPEVFLAVVLLCSSAPSQAQTQAPCKCDKVEQLKLTNVAATDKSGNAVGVSIDRMINGRTTLVAMYGAQFSCAKLPVSIEVDMADLKHVSTVTVRTCPCKYCRCACAVWWKMLGVSRQRASSS